MPPDNRALPDTSPGLETIPDIRSPQGLKKLWNFEARACIGLQKNFDFINVRLD